MFTPTYEKGKWPKECKHTQYRSDRHCAEMICWNYSGKCPKHAPSGRDYEKCTREEKG